MVGFTKTVRYLPYREDRFAERSPGLNAQKRAVAPTRPGKVLIIGARREPDAGTNQWPDPADPDREVDPT